MKKTISSALHCNGQTFASIQRTKRDRLALLFYTTIALIGILLAGCKKDASSNASELQTTSNNAVVSETNPLNSYQGLSAQTSWELQQARAATARYLRIENALADGYADINVVVQEMGYHYLKAENLDATFDFKKPEILVYNRDEDGNAHLVAVEYAVPISLSPNGPPEGFTGTGDSWGTYQGALWTLHAWVWSYNPNGVFNPTNPLVHLH